MGGVKSDITLYGSVGVLALRVGGTLTGGGVVSPVCIVGVLAHHGGCPTVH